MSIFQELQDSIISADVLNDLGVPSASIAILDNGQISASVITNGNENTETVYQACSISKAITALAVAKLVDRGLISYETKVIDHLSDSVIACLTDTDTRHLLQHVTVAMLLSHTSGLSQGGFPGYIGEPPSAEDILAGRPPSNTPRVRFLTFPGSSWSYSGGGFVVLQLVLESILQSTFSQIMRDVVLQPLSMTRSWYGPNPADERNYAEPHTTASVQFPGSFKYHELPELAAAGLWTTPTDLLKAISAIQGSLHTGSGFLKQETAEKIVREVNPSSPNIKMALGWAVDDNFFAHAGDNWPGYNTYFVGTKAKNDMTGLAIMTNSWMGHKVAIKQLVSAVFYLKGWKRYRNFPSLFDKDDYVPFALSDERKIGKRWQEWVGRWDHDWHLIDDNGSPAWQYKSMKAMKLYVAAAPTQSFEDGKEELLFVVVGLDMALRMTWKDGKKVIKRLQVNSHGGMLEEEPLKMSET